MRELAENRQLWADLFDYLERHDELTYHAFIKLVRKVLVLEARRQGTSDTDAARRLKLPYESYRTICKRYDLPRKALVEFRGEVRWVPPNSVAARHGRPLAVGTALRLQNYPSYTAPKRRKKPKRKPKEFDRVTPDDFTTSAPAPDEFV
jgi:hypothetical protein